MKTSQRIDWDSFHFSGAQETRSAKVRAQMGSVYITTTTATLLNIICSNQAMLLCFFLQNSAVI